MRTWSLQSIKARVERLVEASGGEEDKLVLIRWGTPFDHCPACGYDVDAQPRDEAIALATADNGRSVRLAFYWWPFTIKSCPQCGTPLPYEGIVAKSAEQPSRVQL